MTNKMELSFLAKSENESFARITVGAFLAQLDLQWMNLRK